MFLSTIVFNSTIIVIDVKEVLRIAKTTCSKNVLFSNYIFGAKKEKKKNTISKLTRKVAARIERVICLTDSSSNNHQTTPRIEPKNTLNNSFIYRRNRTSIAAFSAKRIVNIFAEYIM